MLLVEGEDDERIWQQVIRSSNGRVRLYPCPVEGVTELAKFEREVSDVLTAVYDNAVGFSLRDRDIQPTEIADVGPLRRMRLNCRAAENLLLTDDVLGSLRLTWSECQARITKWLDVNIDHPHHTAMLSLANNYDRLNADLKEVRNDLVGLLGTNKPWEVLVGKQIAVLHSLAPEPAAGSLAFFLGRDVCTKLLRLQ